MAANARELEIKVNVDVSEALTGLKAIQREAKKATQALKELEAEQTVSISQRIAVANEMLAVQDAQGNDSSMVAMYNGMEYAISMIEGRKPEFKQAVKADE